MYKLDKILSKQMYKILDKQYENLVLNYKNLKYNKIN